MELCRWPIPPWGWGSPGRGERPFPCRSRFPLNGIYRSPPPEGAGSAWRLTRWPCTERKQDIRRFLTDALVTLCRARHLGESPPGEGLTGGGNAPSLSPASHVERFSLEHPTARRATAASSRPLQGGGQLIGDWPDTVSGGRKQDFGRVLHQAGGEWWFDASRWEHNAVSEPSRWCTRPKRYAGERRPLIRDRRSIHVGRGYRRRGSLWGGAPAPLPEIPLMPPSSNSARERKDPGGARPTLFARDCGRESTGRLSSSPAGTPRRRRQAFVLADARHLPFRTECLIWSSWFISPATCPPRPSHPGIGGPPGARSRRRAHIPGLLSRTCVPGRGWRLTKTFRRGSGIINPLLHRDRGLELFAPLVPVSLGQTLAEAGQGTDLPAPRWKGSS